MKILDRISILVFNLCLLLSTIIIPALILASSPAYYHSQFEKNGIYGEVTEDGDILGKRIYHISGSRYDYAVFTDDQIDMIVDHTVDFLFGDKESFALEMDAVYMNGEGYRDGVNIFGETAVLHMQDVKDLMRFALIGSIICAILAAGLLIMFILRSRAIGKFALKYTLLFYGAIFAFAFIFCFVTFLKSGAEDFIFDLWGNIHYLLFPFQPEKYANSFFNDTLTEILTVELFITAVIIVLSVALTFLAAWFVGAVLLGKRAKRQKS